MSKLSKDVIKRHLENVKVNDILHVGIITPCSLQVILSDRVGDCIGCRYNISKYSCAQRVIGNNKVVK